MNSSEADLSNNEPLSLSLSLQMSKIGISIKKLSSNTISEKNYVMLNRRLLVVYFDQHLGAAYPKPWSKKSFLAKKKLKKC